MLLVNVVSGFAALLDAAENIGRLDNVPKLIDFLARDLFEFRPDS